MLKALLNKTEINKVSDMKITGSIKYPFIIVVLIFICFSNTYAQYIELSRTDKPDKKKTLGQTDCLEIRLFGKDDLENSDLTIYKTYSGYFKEGTVDNIKIQYDYSFIDKMNMETGYEKVESKEIFGGKLDDQEIKIEDIDYVIHHKKSEKIFNVIGSSALVGVVISPLFGMYFDDKKNLQMNGETYVISAGFFAIVASISFSASKLFGSKTYYINPDYEGDKNVWKMKVK